MSDLLDSVLEAHGGLPRWRGFSRVRATIVTGGELFEIKGLPQDPTPRQMTVALHHEWASVAPFGAPDQRTDFTADSLAESVLTTADRAKALGYLRQDRSALADLIETKGGAGETPKRAASTP